MLLCPTITQERVPAMAQPSHSGDEGNLPGCSPACCGRKGLAAIQGRENSSALLGGHHSHTCRAPGPGHGLNTASPQKVPDRGSSLFLGTKPLGWKTQEAGEFSAPCKLFFLLSLADTCFHPGLVSASGEGAPSPTSMGRRGRGRDSSLWSFHISCQYAEP